MRPSPGGPAALMEPLPRMLQPKWLRRKEGGGRGGGGGWAEEEGGGGRGPTGPQAGPGARFKLRPAAATKTSTRAQKPSRRKNEARPSSRSRAAKYFEEGQLYGPDHIRRHLRAPRAT